MMCNVFQGGKYVMVFSPTNKDLLNKWVIAKQVKKEYDKVAKTFVYSLKGGLAVQQLLIPKDLKLSIGLIQPYLVVQIYLSEEENFSLEVRVTCVTGCHKRFTFSCQKTTTQVTPLFAIVPFPVNSKCTWQHVCINCADVVNELWHEVYKNIDSVALCGNCSVRQIYTLHKDAFGDIEDNRTWVERYEDALPKQCRFPLQVPQSFYRITKDYLRELPLNCKTQKSQTSLTSEKSTVTSVGSSTTKSSSTFASRKSAASNKTVVLQTGRSRHLQQHLSAKETVLPKCRNISLHADLLLQSRKTPTIEQRVIVIPKSVHKCVSDVSLHSATEKSCIGESSVRNTKPKEVEKTCIANDPSSDSCDSTSEADENCGGSSSSSGSAGTISSRRVDVWIPPLSPVSSALCLARELTMKSQCSFRSPSNNDFLTTKRDIVQTLGCSSLSSLSEYENEGKNGGRKFMTTIQFS